MKKTDNTNFKVLRALGYTLEIVPDKGNIKHV